MAAATVYIETFSDADFAYAFRWLIEDVPFDFTDHVLLMHIRKHVDDVEVFVALSSEPGGGITFTPDVDGKLTTFNVNILREQMVRMAPGDYVHSLILVRPDALREDIWRGTLTHALGPTREQGPPP